MSKGEKYRTAPIDGYSAHKVYVDKDGEAYLEHQCDNWYIGGIDEIDQLIRDLEEARRAIEEGREIKRCGY
jgi:hypothetical protein